MNVLNKLKSWLGVFAPSHKKVAIERNETMFVIVGLGNPSKKYQGTRHNVGFEVIEALADKFQIDITTSKHRSLIGKGIIDGHKVLLAMPQTFMNLSGEAVGSITNYFKIDPAHELLVIYDDVSLDVGQIRIREKGSAGGHNGIKSIISHLGSQDFPRIKIGVGEKPSRMNLADYVLGHFTKLEKLSMDKGYEDAIASIRLILADEIDKAMNTYNRKKAAD